MLEDCKAWEALWSKAAKDFLMDLGSCKLAFHCSKTWSENCETRFVV